MSDIRFNQWLHNSGTGGVSQVDGGHVGIGTTNPEIAVHSGNNKILNVGIVTASTYYGSDANMTGLPGGSTGLDLNDNIKIRIGDSQDFQLYHDGNNSLIQDSGTGHVQVRSGTFTIGNLALSKTSAIFNSGAQQELRYNNTTRFETTDTGAKVTGNLSVSSRLGIGTESPSNELDIINATSSQDIRIWSQGDQNASRLILRTGNNGNSWVLFGDTADEDIGSIRYVNYGNDNSMRFTTNTTERVRITGTGRINIGDADQSQNVDQLSVTVAAQNALDNVARFQSNATASGTSETLVKIYKGAGYGGVVSGYITQGSEHGLKFYTANNGTLGERLRVGFNNASGTRVTLTGNAAANPAIDPYSKLLINDSEARLQLCSTNSGSNASSIILSNESKHFVVHQRGPVQSNNFEIAYQDIASPTDMSATATPYFRISTGGQVTKPNHPVFSGAYVGSAAANFGTSEFTMNFNTVMTNQGNHYDTSTGEYTCPVAGKYWISAQAHLQAQTGGAYTTIRLQKNSVTQSNAWKADGSGGTIFAHAIVSCGANDILRVRILTNDSTQYTAERYWVASIYLMA